MKTTFNIFGILLLLAGQSGLAESGAVNDGWVGEAAGSGSLVLSSNQATKINRNICRKMGSYLADITVTEEDFYQCEEKSRVKFCSTFPDEFEPRDFIRMYISQELEITNHDELDQVLPDAVSQLMTMPCDKDRTADYEQNYGDNFIKRAIWNQKVHKVVNNFFVPLCRKQADYQGCIEKLIYAAEPIPDGSEENIVDFARKIGKWKLTFKHMSLTQTDVDRIFGMVVSLEENLNTARAKQKSEAP